MEKNSISILSNDAKEAFKNLRRRELGLYIHSDTQKRKYFILLVILTIIFASIYPVLVKSSYNGTLDPYSTVEMVGAFFGLITGFAMITHFYTLGNRFHLFIGLAFFVNGAEDFIHGLFPFVSKYGLIGIPISSLSQFISGTHVTGRMMMGLILIFAPFIPSWLGKVTNIKRVTKWVSLAVIIFTMGGTVLASQLSLPRFIFPDRFISRPVDFLSAVILFIALCVFLRKYHRDQEMLTWWISLSIAVNLVGQVMMSFSKLHYDPFFNIAHVYKVLGYVIPLLGFTFYQIFVILGLKQARKILKKNEQELSFQAAFLQYAGDIAVAMDLEENLIYVNDAAVKVFGDSPEVMLGQPFIHYVAEKDYPAYRAVVQKTVENEKYAGEFTAKPNNGSEFSFEFSSVLLLNEDEQMFAIVVVGRDVTEQHRMQKELEKYAGNLEKMVAERTREIRMAYDKLKQAQAQLLQSEKLAGIGQLAAGVAHEINNPIGFVTSNLVTLNEYSMTLKNLFTRYDRLTTIMLNGNGTEEDIQNVLSQIEEILKQDNLAYILEDLEPLLSESIEGVHRVKEIVQSLKSFSRVDESELKDADINEGIEATLRVVWNELKYKAQIHKKLGNLPLIRCYPGQLNQVFMNILVNAAQSIPKRGDITIETKVLNNYVIVRISDTGKGISSEHLSKIFDPFFTTKPVGKGTGLGLSLSYSIVKKHNGTIDVESEEGKGTTFTIRLPVEGKSEHE